MADAAPPPEGRFSLARMNLPGMRKSAQSTAQRSDILFALGIIGILMVLVFPVPPWLLDMLLSISFTVSVLILMTVMTCMKIKSRKQRIRQNYADPSTRKLFSNCNLLSFVNL